MRSRHGPPWIQVGSGAPRRRTSAIPWQRRPREVVDLSDGTAWARWWSGGAFNYAAAAATVRDADRATARLTWEGEDGATIEMTGAELATAVDLAVRRLAAHGVRPGDRVGILLPMLIETVVAVLALGRLAGDLHPDLQRLRRTGDRRPAGRLRRVGPHHRRRIPATRLVGPAQARRRRGGRGRAHDRARAGRSARRGRRAGAMDAWPATPGGTTRSRAKPTGRCPMPAWRRTPRRRTCSSIRPGPRDDPKGPSTCTAGSRSRPPRTSPTSSTSGQGTPCSGSPTSAG